MTRRVFALLVGIDRYLAASPLQGCGNDVRVVEEFLRVRVRGHGRPDLRVLKNEQATRDAVVTGLRDHLGQAGPGDTALFWFSGHGSRAKVPDGLWHLEPSGTMQTLLCHDSRHGDVADLWDKELSLLLSGIAVTGCHVVVVADSCHSFGVTRDTIRAVPPLTTAPKIDSLLPELRRLAALPPVEHVELAACASAESAVETWADGEEHGLFSWSLVSAMRRLGPSATYRELLTAARCDVERHAYQQVPQLQPVTPGIADQPFLGGRITPSATGMRMRRARGDWEIDAGSCHGLSVGPDNDDVRVAVPGPELREARVVRVHPERSVVRPLGWEPDEDLQYPVVVSRVPTPAVSVGVDGEHAPTGDQVLAALATLGPGGGPSPHLRTARSHEMRTPELVIDVREPGRVRIRDGEGTALCDEMTDVQRDGGRRVAAALEHLARVRRVKALVNPFSALVDAVSVELVDAFPGELTAPLDRPALRPSEDGAVHLRYRQEHGRWVPPTIFVRLRNDSDRPLYYVLLNITEKHRVHAGLFPGAQVAPGRVGAALYGRPVELRLPVGTPVEEGATTQDWLVLLAAEKEFSSSPFELPAVDEAWPGRTRAPLAVTGLLGRLGLAAVHRDAGGTADSACDWVTLAVPVVTRVPAARDEKVSASG
ncbi:caspase domain-containing protein [Micromonospora sp. NPDC049175]|uniref:caspase family protein n=1 Tax=Micromonospora sp. NPDC049175 TaxID=3364266 RepID=UPI0037171300